MCLITVISVYLCTQDSYIILILFLYGHVHKEMYEKWQKGTFFKNWVCEMIESIHLLICRKMFPRFPSLKCGLTSDRNVS